MKVSKEEFEILRELEVSLWKPETRFNIAYMESILSPHFFEFGRSGKIYKRDDTLDITPQEIRAILPLKNFKIHLLDEHVALITYVSQVTYNDLQVGNRSSLWSKTTGKWLLHFHQGTPTTLTGV